MRLFGTCDMYALCWPYVVPLVPWHMIDRLAVCLPNWPKLLVTDLQVAMDYKGCSADTAIPLVLGILGPSRVVPQVGCAPGSPAPVLAGSQCA